jgi:hypothetical protein
MRFDLREFGLNVLGSVADAAAASGLGGWGLRKKSENVSLCLVLQNGNSIIVMLERHRGLELVQAFLKGAFASITKSRSGNLHVHFT